MYIPDNYDQFESYESTKAKDDYLNDKLDKVVSVLEEIKETLIGAEGEQDHMTYITKAIDQIDNLLEQI